MRSRDVPHQPRQSLMATAAAVAAAVLDRLFGPTSPIPGWAWLALVVMILWGLLLPDRPGDSSAED